MQDHQYGQYSQPQTRPYGPQTARVMFHQFRHGGQGRLVMFAAIVGLLGLALGAAGLTLLVLYKSTATAQLSQMRQEITTVDQQLQKAQNAANTDASNYSGLSGKVSALGTAMNAWNLICAQALESQAGPGTYYFPCSSTRP